MTALSLTRQGLLAAFVGAAFAIAAPAANAARNSEAESYVQANAQQAITSLAVASAQARQEQFGRLMREFADVPRIANFVLGRYSATLRADTQLRTDWLSTFQDYAMAVYEDQLDRFRGSQIRVTGSTERVQGRDVIVQSEIAPRGRNSRPMQVQWRILRDGQGWKVVDVSLVLEGNEIWLAQQQQRDFLAQLDRSRGDVRALITNVRNSTAEMRSRIRSRAT